MDWLLPFQLPNPFFPADLNLLRPSRLLSFVLQQFPSLPDQPEKRFSCCVLLALEFLFLCWREVVQRPLKPPISCKLWRAVSLSVPKCKQFCWKSGNRWNLTESPQNPFTVGIITSRACRNSCNFAMFRSVGNSSSIQSYLDVHQSWPLQMEALLFHRKLQGFVRRAKIHPAKLFQSKKNKSCLEK